MFQSRRFLSQFLETDIRDDRLYRAGAVTDGWIEDGDAVFRAPLLYQKTGADLGHFDSTETSGEAYIRVRAYGSEILRVSISRARTVFREDSPMLQYHASIHRQALSIIEKPDGWLLTANEQERAWIDRADFGPRFSPDGKIWTRLQSADSFFGGLWDALPAFFLDKRDSTYNGPNLAGFAFHIEPGEHICGSGERFERIDLVGRQFELVNYDALGVNNNRAYKNIPFLLSSRPYGLFVHSHARQRLDIGAHSTRALQWLVEEDQLDFFLIGGGSLAQILYNYRRLTGFPAMPPVWSFGAWMSRMTYRSEEEASSIAGRLRAEGYPMDVIHLDTGWFDREWVCDWRFSGERFPDPHEFFERMLARGFHVSLWQYPYIHRDSSLVEEALQHGWVARESDPVYAVGLGYTFDFTRPGTADWYARLLAPLFQEGAAAIKADFGEEVDETAQYAAITGRSYHNLFALLYQKAVWEATRQARGEGETVIWARSAWAGSQRYPVHWGGDSACTFDGLSGSLCGGLHFGLSGFAFWSHDVGGFYGVPDFMNHKPSERLYLRWVQVGVFTSHMRFHGTTPREPWEYPGVAAQVREWLRFRYALLPYILREARDCVQSGLPMLRALVLDWPNDPAAWSINDEYLFGDSFLVCPVLHDGVLRSVYLPAGRWVDFWTGQDYEGPTNLILVDPGNLRLPLYVRYGATIEFSEPVQHTGQLSQAQKFTITFDDRYHGFEASELARWVHI